MLSVNNFKRSFLRMIILLMGLLANFSLLSAQEIPDELMGHLRKWDGKIDPITVEWIRTRESSYTIDELLEKLRLTEQFYAYLEPLKIHCCFQKGKIHSRVEERRSGVDSNENYVETKTDIVHFSFDNKNFYNWSGEVRDLENTTLFIDTKETVLNNYSPQRPIFRTDTYFPYVGIQFPNTAGELGTSTGSVIPILLKRSILKECKKVDGLWRIVLEEDNSEIGITLLHTYYLKPEWGYLAKRYTVQYISKGTPRGFISRLEIEAMEFRKVPEASYGLPFKVISKVYNHDNENIYTEEFNVTLAHIKSIPDDHFVQTEKRVGATIVDFTLPEAKNLPSGRVEYQIPSNIEDLDKVIAAAKRGEAYEPVTADPVAENHERTLPSTINYYYVIMASLCVLLVVAIFYLRKNKQS